MTTEPATTGQTGQTVEDARVASRAAALRPSERRAGSDDPERQAEVILEDAEERRRAAAHERDPDGPTD